LEEQYGRYLFITAELNLKTFNPSIIEDLRKENHLVSKYVKLIASAKIMFEGKERNLMELQPFMESTSRETRRKSFEAHWKFLRIILRNWIDYMMSL
jgi:oligoendopeptidase F